MFQIRQMTAFLTIFILCTGVLALSACGQAVSEFKDCDECPVMVEIPAGSFLMGSPADEEGRTPKEDPQHKVIISKAFAVGKFEVTFKEWDACVAGGGCNGYHPDDGGYGREDHPVINVSWDDAKAYLLWLSKLSGKSYRLLSEAEWEYVARAGTSTPFSFGTTITSELANYNARVAYDGGPEGEYRDQTLPVGSFSANAFGLYDLHGNVYEWAEDCYHKSYVGAPSDGSAWLNDRCRTRIKRGGGWLSFPNALRASDRSDYFSDFRSTMVGFRVTRDLD